MTQRERDDASVDSDLAWLAFRYAAGELDPDDAHAFDERLARDAAACEHLAEAARLIDTIHLAVSSVPRAASFPGRRRPRGRFLATCTAAAATVALALAAGRLLAPPPSSPPASAESLLAWTPLDPDDPGADLFETSDIDLQNEPIFDPDPEFADEPVPSWMLALARLDASPADDAAAVESRP